MVVVVVWVRSVTDEYWEEDSDVSHYLDMTVLNSLCFGMVGIGIFFHRV